MGSIDKAVVTGFICRLCSEMHRVVIHIYGEEGVRRSIGPKINKYLSINVTRRDPLPKTICKHCLDRLENQHRLVKCIAKTASILRDRRVNLSEPNVFDVLSLNKRSRP